ncbi:diacylglycerol kinase family protein [Paenibacillus soyae]|uniref:Diacylglycerol kinase family protein n=1 Tax=Paenibacillus soyae TaxID=2969249 RepID=A0A9X2MN83_9BACL|nr:diacylglycerol kinase family protein [Paenibacillus soyae]MCR2803177.1 diacylglycerol kinase family protein [Paenibacillus soyae]
MRAYLRSFTYALSGIRFALKSERNMRFHCGAAVVVIALGLWLSITVTEWCLILLSIALVMSLELVNTAIEQTVNLASPNQHPVAKAAKDVAAGAVTLAAFFASIIGLIVFGPPLWRFVTGS